MLDFLIQAVFSNTCFATVLAVFAVVSLHLLRSPRLAHTLWVCVLLKLVAPPLIALPILVPAVSPDPQTVNSFEHSETKSKPQYAMHGSADPLASTQSSIIPLLPIWVLGSLCLFAWSLAHVLWFHHLLFSTAQDAPSSVLSVTGELANRFRLRTKPRVVVSNANISPMVWWIGGRVYVVLSKSIVAELDERGLRLVLAHEFAHVMRRDYLVRWVEWGVRTTLWWNPLVWWAQHQLRASEEACCDALVLEKLNPDVVDYAESIVNVIELLASTVIRQPCLSSNVSGGNLERRVDMILSGKLTVKRMFATRAAVLVACVLCLPLGIAQATDTDAVKKRLDAAISANEITVEQAAAMLALIDEKPSRAMKEQQYDKQREAYRRKVELGEMSKQEAEKQLKQVRAQLLLDAPEGNSKLALKSPPSQRFISRPSFQEPVSDVSASRLIQMRGMLLQMEQARFARLVESGQIANDAATERLQELRTVLFPRPASPEKALTGPPR